MSTTGVYVGALCLFLIMWLAGTTANDIKTKRGIEAQQNEFVAKCSAQQDANVLDYVKRLQGCRDAAELKFKMPTYLDRVK